MALLSTAHPTDFGNIANTPITQVDLNEATLLNAMVSIRVNFRDQAGLKIFARGRKLLIAPGNEPVAIRLTKTELRPGTNDNDVNAILTTAGGLPEGYITNDYLTNSPWWFFALPTSRIVMDATYCVRDRCTGVDFVTDNLLVKAYERYSFSYNNWRSIWGSTPST